MKVYLENEWETSQGYVELEEVRKYEKRLDCVK